MDYGHYIHYFQALFLKFLKQIRFFFFIYWMLIDNRMEFIIVNVQLIFSLTIEKYCGYLRSFYK